MKTTIKLTLLCLLGTMTIAVAQKKKEPGKGTDSVKQMNLLDEQVKILGSVFEMGDASENPFGGATNYLELLEQSDMDPELKKELREQYQIYDLSLDPKKKDSLALAFNKKLKEAMEKSLNDTQNNNK